jgi:uncharacterized protein YbaP (TraB family)
MSYKKFLFTFLLCCGFVKAAQAQLLYKISGNGLSKPSYILGTHHFASVAMVSNIPGVTDALTNTDQVYGELKMDDASWKEAQNVTVRESTLPNGQTIDKLLTAEQMKRLNAFMKSTMQTDFNNPKVMEQMGHLKPAALSTNLSMLLYLTHHMGEFDPTNQFDRYFQMQALKNNEPVGGLETAEFEAKLLFSSDPLEEQVKDLMCLVDHADFNLQMSEKLSKAYNDQDLDAVKKASEEKMNNSCDPTPEYEEKLIYSRNADWLKKMPTIMAERPTFFTVGCLHLCGEKGVLQLLRNAGYTVEAVKQ